MGTAEYTVKEMKSMLDSMSGMYDLVRVVDPRECRVLGFDDEDRIKMQERCYGVWESDQRCTNCSSAAACRTSCHREKKEHFNDSLFNIQSNPVRLRMNDGTLYDAVVALISITPDVSDPEANDRRAEDTGNSAAVYHSRHDSLTGALNADDFYELSRELMIKHPGTEWVMISADIMGFHTVNDLFGVEKGNEVLLKTAELLKQLAGETDGLCGRLGGDVFAVLMPATEYSEEKLFSLAAGLNASEKSGIYSLRIHFGVYKIGDAAVPVHVMFSRADAALRKIHDDARETLAYYDERMLESDRFEHSLISSFDRMLGEGWFRMYLQPLTGEDGKAFGAEALVRCVRPDGTVIMPGAFIPTLENAGLIQDLDVYMWELAVKQLKEWQGTDKEHLTISVNMSPRDFYSIDVFEVLTGLVSEYGVDSSRLRLEITETALMREPEKVNDILSRLQAEGFIIEIDDFGKGYSSLSMLKDVNADLLKIDMGFLEETRNNRRSMTILNSVIGMADSLGMGVISEGVETEDQLQMLVGMGCRRFQGFYFSRPIPVSEFEALY